MRHGESYLRARRVKRLAYAWARYMSVGKSLPAKKIYEAQTDGCRERFDDMAEELYEALHNAGLKVRLCGEDR